MGFKNVHSRGGSGPLGGATSGLRWAYGKERLHGDLRLFPVNDSVRGRCVSPEKEAEEMEAQTDEGRPIPQINEFSEAESISRKPRPSRGDVRDLREARRLQKHRAPHGQHIPECIGAPEKQGQHGAMQRAATHNSLASRMPLKLQMKIYGQRGSLGISIAGGRGSLPYKEHDEGVFISRVAKGGPAEKADSHRGQSVGGAAGGGWGSLIPTALRVTNQTTSGMSTSLSS
ncbi:hypothetical protein ANANG_G00301100 [Anguilla anguilla]|uniref:PDZ domain-containing protein n=1 Tax=Anguilla anguilla TaxID=7936 RepID=A0A9D3LJ34_ANGAN|nr:hypothetical protein ANANG_G00301100 [Anguilla anguilla]